MGHGFSPVDRIFYWHIWNGKSKWPEGGSEGILTRRQVVVVGDRKKGCDGMKKVLIY